MGGKERKFLTDEEKEEILSEYINSRTEPGRKPVTQRELAKKYGVDQSRISRIICDSDTIERMRRRTRVSVLIAQAMAESAAPKIMEETIKSAFKKRDAKFEYINQGDRRDILDRAGVRVEKGEKQEITLSFASGLSIEPGMPAGEDAGGGEE